MRLRKSLLDEHETNSSQTASDNGQPLPQSLTWSTAPSSWHMVLGLQSSAGNTSVQRLLHVQRGKPERSKRRGVEDTRRTEKEDRDRRQELVARIMQAIFQRLHDSELFVGHRAPNATGSRGGSNANNTQGRSTTDEVNDNSISSAAATPDILAIPSDVRMTGATTTSTFPAETSTSIAIGQVIPSLTSMIQSMILKHMVGTLREQQLSKDRLPLEWQFLAVGLQPPLGSLDTGASGTSSDGSGSDPTLRSESPAIGAVGPLTNNVEEAQSATISEGKLEEGKLEESKLEESKLEESKLEQSKLEQSKLEQSKLEQSKLEQGLKPFVQITREGTKLSLAYKENLRPHLVYVNNSGSPIGYLSRDEKIGKDRDEREEAIRLAEMEVFKPFVQKPPTNDKEDASSKDETAKAWSLLPRNAMSSDLRRDDFPRPPHGVSYHAETRLLREGCYHIVVSGPTSSDDKQAPLSKQYNCVFCSLLRLHHGLPFDFHTDKVKSWFLPEDLTVDQFFGEAIDGIVKSDQFKSLYKEFEETDATTTQTLIDILTDKNMPWTAITSENSSADTDDEAERREVDFNQRSQQQRKRSKNG